MANSSMLVFPTIIAPALRSASAAVDSYGELYPSNMREPQVVGSPCTVILSFIATGTPSILERALPSLRRLSAASACSKSIFSSFTLI